ITIPGGSMKGTNLKWTVRIPGEFDTIEELRDAVVMAKNGMPIYLRDLADVQFGYQEQSSYSRLNGQASVTLSILKRSGENIINIADEVKRILQEGKKNFPANVEYVILADQSKEIRTMVNDLENNIIAGLILVFGVLYLFMGPRTGLLVGIAIPLSMLISFIAIGMLGYTLNMIVLFSLILALGMLVDNAVVIVENIYRHHSEGKGRLLAAKEATQEVGMPVITSTITTLLVFLPMIFWPGIVGEFMKFLPITLVITLASSLFVALVFNPTIASGYLKVDKKMSQLPGDRFLHWLIYRYEKALRWALGHRKTVVAAMFSVYVLMFLVYGAFNHGMEFFPDLEPAQAWIEVEAPIGTKLETSDEIVDLVEHRIEDTIDLKNYVADVGKSSNMFDFGAEGGSSHKSQVTIDFLDRHLRRQNSFKTLEQVREKVDGIPGADINVTQPQSGPPTGSAVEIQIQGEDFGILSDISNQIQKKIEDVPGLTKLSDNYEKGKPEMTILLDREKAALFGLNTAQIANTIRTAINGTEASQFRIGQEEYDITVRFDENFRNNYNDLLNLTVFHEGRHYPLANYAIVDFSTGLSSVNHVDGDRVVTINGEALGRSSAEVLQEVKDRLVDFETPESYSLSYAGQDVEQQEASAFLMRAFLIAIMLMFFVLVTQFNSVTLPLVIMITILLSFFGVFFGLLVTFKPFGIIMTGIGIISLAGIVVNNAIVMIDYIRQLRERGMEKLEAIIQGGKIRLRPVILTAVTTILGLIPLTVGINIDFIGLFKGDISRFVQFGAESSQWWSGMGVAVIFGLLFATALTLIFVPVMYYMLSDLLTDLVAKFRQRAAEEVSEAVEPA
ncbi:MAG: efflux RND transporter permease subunit, partial [bacterium]